MKFALHLTVLWSVPAELIALRIPVSEDFCLNLGLDPTIVFVYNFLFRFPKPISKKSHERNLNNPRPIPSTSFPIYYSLNAPFIRRFINNTERILKG